MAMKLNLKKPLRGEQTFPASEMVMGTMYMTAKSAWPKQVPCRLVKVDYLKKQVVLSAYYENLGEWNDVPVELDYPVRKMKEEEQMKLKSKKADPKTSTAKVSKTKGATTGVGVFDTWALAFKKHGADPKAVVAFMKSEYPGRSTDWAKWVNGMRQRYNRGLLTGGTAPSIPIDPYVAKSAPKAPKAKKGK